MICRSRALRVARRWGCGASDRPTGCELEDARPGLSFGLEAGLFARGIFSPLHGTLATPSARGEEGIGTDLLFQSFTLQALHHRELRVPVARPGKLVLATRVRDSEGIFDGWPPPRPGHNRRDNQTGANKRDPQHAVRMRPGTTS